MQENLCYSIVYLGKCEQEAAPAPLRCVRSCLEALEDSTYPCCRQLPWRGTGRRDRSSLPSCPPNHPRELLSELRKPGEWVCSWGRLSWGCYSPVERKEPRPETCPSQPLVLITPELLSGGAGTNPHSALGRVWGQGWTLSSSAGPCYVAFAAGWDIFCVPLVCRSLCSRQLCPFPDCDLAQFQGSI